MHLLPLFLAILLAASQALADADWFETPSGNIACNAGIGDDIPSDIECTIFERYGPPARLSLARCGEALGHQFSMRERGAVTVKCGEPGSRPESGSPGGNDIAYGRAVTYGGITCFSSRRGLDCRNADGRGFFLSRRRQSVF